MTQDLPAGATLGADENCDAEAFVEDRKARKIVPHVTSNGCVSKTGKVSKAGKVSKTGKVSQTSVPREVAASEGYAMRPSPSV